MYQLARAHAMMQERDFVLPDDVKAMASAALAHRLLVSAVRDLPEPKLFEPTNDPRPGQIAPTYYELLHGIVQHDVYHAGQIAILKKAL